MWHLHADSPMVRVKGVSTTDFSVVKGVRKKLAHQTTHASGLGGAPRLRALAGGLPFLLRPGGMTDLTDTPMETGMYACTHHTPRRRWCTLWL